MEILPGISSFTKQPKLATVVTTPSKTSPSLIFSRASLATLISAASETSFSERTTLLASLSTSRGTALKYFPTRFCGFFEVSFPSWEPGIKPVSPSTYTVTPEGLTPLPKTATATSPCLAFSSLSQEESNAACLKDQRDN